jgi:hypothetical protein
MIELALAQIASLLVFYFIVSRIILSIFYCCTLTQIKKINKFISILNKTKYERMGIRLRMDKNILILVKYTGHQI